MTNKTLTDFLKDETSADFLEFSGAQALALDRCSKYAGREIVSGIREQYLTPEGRYELLKIGALTALIYAGLC